MAEDVPPDPTPEQPDETVRRGDDESLRNALSALLGLGSTPSDSDPGTSSGLSIPPPRPAEPLADDGTAAEERLVSEPDSRAAPEFTVPPVTSPLADEWAPGGSSDRDFWGPPEAEPGDQLAADRPPEVAFPDGDIWGSPEPRASADDRAPVTSSDSDLWAASEPRAADDDWATATSSDSDFWGPPDAPLPDIRPDVYVHGAGIESDPVLEPVSPAAEAQAPPDMLVPDVFFPAEESEAQPAPTPDADAWSEPFPANRPLPVETGTSIGALQEAGLAGPLNAAMGDLRRLQDDTQPGVGGVVPPATRLGSGRSPARERVLQLQDWWASRRRELVPGLVVAAVVVLAFAVVLLGRGSEDRPRVDTGAQQSTTVAPAADLGTVPGPVDTTTSIPPIDEAPVIPGAPDPSSPAAGESSVAGDGSEGDGGLTIRSGRRSGLDGGSNAPAPPPPAANPKPPAPAPAPAPPPPAPPAPTPTTPPTTPPAPGDDPTDICDRLTGAARQACLDSRRQGGNG